MSFYARRISAGQHKDRVRVGFYDPDGDWLDAPASPDASIEEAGYVVTYNTSDGARWVHYLNGGTLHRF